MTALLLFTDSSPLFVSLALREIRKSAGEAIVVDLDDNIHRQLKELRISSLPIRAGMVMDWGQRDIDFKKLSMPGEQLGENFPNTSLPMWKPMAMDRLSFWYRWEAARKEFEYVMALRWDRAIVPMDLYHPLPFALARHSGRDVIGAQVGSIKTREWFDLLCSHAVPFGKLIVKSDQDAVFVTKCGYRGQIETVAL